MPDADSRSYLPKQIAILGPGLLGGSLALAVRRYLPEAGLRIWARRPEALEQLRAMGFAGDSVSDDLARVTRDCDFMVLATPVGVMPGLVARVLATGAPAEGALFTDVGSVKKPLVDRLSGPCAEAGRPFIGSHPMAGSEKAGLTHACEQLFQKARCILTPTPESPAEGVTRVEHFWRALGARVSIMTAREHDRVVARISHMPHAAAAAIVRAAMDGDGAVVEFSGGGFQDTTRVASGLPDMWAEILLENREEVMDSIRDLRKNLSDLLEFLEKMDEEQLASFLSCAREQRQRLRTRG